MCFCVGLALGEKGPAWPWERSLQEATSSNVTRVTAAHFHCILGSGLEGEQSRLGPQALGEGKPSLSFMPDLPVRGYASAPGKGRTLDVQPGQPGVGVWAFPWNILALTLLSCTPGREYMEVAITPLSPSSRPPRALHTRPRTQHWGGRSVPCSSHSGTWCSVGLLGQIPFCLGQ